MWRGSFCEEGGGEGTVWGLGVQGFSGLGWNRMQSTGERSEACEDGGFGGVGGVLEGGLGR